MRIFQVLRRFSRISFIHCNLYFCQFFYFTVSVLFFGQCTVVLEFSGAQILPFRKQGIQFAYYLQRSIMFLFNLSSHRSH